MFGKIKKIIAKGRSAKKKTAQAMLEFAAILPLLIMILLGTYDLFNLSFSYLQMTFLGHGFLGANLMNQTLGGRNFGNNSQVGRYAKEMAENQSGTAGYDRTGGGGFPMFFFFGQNKDHRKDNYTFCVKQSDSSGARSRTDSVGQMYCYEIWHNVDLITGRMMFGQERITLKKTICAIQEKQFNGSKPQWESLIACPGDMKNYLEVRVR